MIPAALRQRYQEPPRRYHTLRHLVAVLAALRRWQGAPLPPALEQAALYHDAVYEPQRGDNEEASAALVPLDLPERERVVALILATKTHQSDDPLGQLLLDADLWILGAPRRTYARYARLIREEYRHVAENDYRRGRATVLERFLTREHLYHGEHPDREARARANLQRELAALRSPL